MVQSTTDKAATTATSDNRTILAPDASGTIHLPQGIEAGNLDISREGQNLVLTAPDGTVLVVEGYFSAAEAPLILSEGGAMLSPQLVQSFLKTSGNLEVAATETASDKSPVGEVTEVSGEATVTRADGTKEKITAGTDIYEGDIVETDSKGAVNIKFVDESTFAVSENARLAIDDFSFNASDQSGTTGVSILRGVFMFTSGLVGRENPDAVTINTPVGSIGIRGTIIGGEISENGQSQISVIEGAIVVRNGNGEQILSQQFETVTLTGYNNPIQNVGVMDANTFSQTYSSVRSVAPNLFTSINDAAGENTNQPQQQDTQQTPESTEQNAQGQQESSVQDNPSATPLPQPAETQVIFQVLDTGSNIRNTLGAAPENQPFNPNPEIAPVTVTPPPPPSSFSPDTPDDNQAPPSESVLDTRPPAPAVFILAGSVNEESPVGTVVGTVGMSQALPFPVSYSIVNNPGNRFSINPNTGVVTLLAPAADVDTAGPTTYNLTVRVQRTETGQFTDSLLNVNVTPVNETPEFNLSHTAITVSESGSTPLSISKVGATDEEGTNITYTVSGLVNGHIEVSGNTQTTFTQTQLNSGVVAFVQDGAEPDSGASFYLTAGDGNTTSAPLQFSVTVTNTNDAPVIVSNGGDAPVNLNISENTTAITSVMITDSDLGDTVSYSLSGVDASRFSITSNGILSFIASPNFESPNDNNVDNIYQFTVIATDSGGLSDTQTINITVTDANDAPTITSNGGGTGAMINIAENMSGVTTVAASDVDAASVLVYSISGGADAGLFNINGSTGALTFATPRDYENPSDYDTDGIYDVQVKVSDGQGGEDVQDLSITVTDVNEAPSSVSLISANSITETNSSAATDISAVTIVDSEPLANLSAGDFVVKRNTGSGYVTDSRFEVYDNAGIWTLRVKSGQVFNYEQESLINLRVDLTDGGSTVSNSTDLALSIGDINEASHTFTFNDGSFLHSSSYNGLIQGQKTGSYIGVIKFVEPDTATIYKTNETHFDIVVTSVTGLQSGTLTNADFEVKEIIRDGIKEFILKLKDTRGAVDFINTGGQVTLDIKVDRLGDGFLGGDDQIITVSLYGRDDRMVIDSVDGDNGFRIVNNSRFDGARFGQSIAVGDFDNDGINDLIFGAPKADNADTENSGGIYALASTTGFKGDANDGIVKLSTNTGTPFNGFFKEVQTVGDDNNKFYGSSIAALRRFNGGSGADIAVSNAGDGTIDIIRDGASASITTIHTITTGASGAEKENAIKLASIGDINGDGFTDLLVGTQHYDNTYTNEGKAFVVFGSNDTSNINASSISGRGFYLPNTSIDSNSFFGNNVTGVGDFNGDGRTDFAVAAIGVDTDGVGGNNSQGQVTLFFGSSSASTGYYASGSSKVIINGTTNNGSIGEQMAGAGDFNDDGLSDLMIRDGASGNGGEVYIIKGSTSIAGNNVNLGTFGTPSGYQGFKIFTSAAGFTIGKTIGSAGDFNGDGYDDVFVDVRKDLGGSNYEHTLAVIYGNGNSTNIDLATALLDPTKSYKIEIGANVETITAAAAGDINGDGFKDIVIGNPARTYGNAEQNGEAFVVYGGNYSGAANVFTNTANALVANSNFVGSDGNDTLNTNFLAGISFYGGDGDDTLKLTTNSGIRNFDGGRGLDTLKLFFSSDEPTTGTNVGTNDYIDLLGVSKKITGIEKIQFDSNSRDDFLQLDVRDIISLASSNSTGKIRIEAINSYLNDENSLTLFNGNIGTPAGDLSSLSTDLRFTKNGSQEQYDGINFFVYTHTASGVQMLVDDRLAGAGTLGS